MDRFGGNYWRSLLLHPVTVMTKILYKYRYRSFYYSIMMALHKTESPLQFNEYFTRGIDNFWGGTHAMTQANL